MSQFTGAHQASLDALTRDGNVPGDFDAIVSRYGYEVASAAWRSACNWLDHMAECDGCDS